MEETLSSFDVIHEFDLNDCHQMPDFLVDLLHGIHLSQTFPYFLLYVFLEQLSNCLIDLHVYLLKGLFNYDFALFLDELFEFLLELLAGFRLAQELAPEQLDRLLPNLAQDVLHIE